MPRKVMMRDRVCMRWGLVSRGRRDFGGGLVYYKVSLRAHHRYMSIGGPHEIIVIEIWWWGRTCICILVSTNTIIAYWSSHMWDLNLFPVLSVTLSMNSSFNGYAWKL